MPGVIEASRDGVVKTVHIREGNVVHATSNDRDDSLGNFLLRSGRIAARDFLDTMRQREQLKRRHGELLVEGGMLSPSEVYQAIRKQVEAIVWSLFDWTEGRVTFTIGEFEPEHQVRILLPMRQVIMQGIKGAPDAKALVARLGRRDTVFEPSWRTEDLIEAALEREEVDLLSLVDGRRTLYEVCSEGPYSAADNGKLLYAFLVLQSSAAPAARRSRARAASRPTRSRPAPSRSASAPRARTSAAAKAKAKAEDGRGCRSTSSSAWSAAAAPSACSASRTLRSPPTTASSRTSPGSPSSTGRSAKQPAS